MLADKLLAVLGIVLFVFALPIVIPIAIVDHALSRRRMRRVAESMRCEVCGTALGQAALDLADTVTDPAIRAIARQGMRIRFVRTFHAICTICGARYRYDERVFHRVFEDDGSEAD